jgi:hypothetical protein
MSTYFSTRARTVLTCGVAAGLVGGALLTQQAFAGTPAPAGPAVAVGHSVASSSTSGSRQAVPLSSTTVKRVTSDVSQLKKLGIQINGSVLIDVADDGLDRYLSVGDGGTVDFTGTPTSDETNRMMSLKPAKVLKKAHPAKNRVVIAPPFYNEDLGKGSCVADIKKGVLQLATCKVGAANQIWHVIPAGDSGQFELHGAHTKIRVNKGTITTGKKGYVGLQTLDFK